MNPERFESGEEDSFLEDSEKTYPVQSPSHILSTSKVTSKRHVIPDVECQLAAKNIVIDSLKNKLRTVESQLYQQQRSMSGRSSRGSTDFVDGGSSPSGNLSPTQHELPVNHLVNGETPPQSPFLPTVLQKHGEGSCHSGNRQQSGDSLSGAYPTNLGLERGISRQSDVRYDPSVVNSSNSTDSEKLANNDYSMTEVIHLQSELALLTKCNDDYKTQVEDYENQVTLLEKRINEAIGLKSEFEQQYRDLERKWTNDKDAFDKMDSEKRHLQHQLEVERTNRREVELENDELRKQELHLKNLGKQKDQMNEILKKEIEKLKQQKNSFSKVESLVMSQEGAGSEEEESQRLVGMVQQLLAELEQTAGVVRQQNQVIRRLRAKNAGMALTEQQSNITTSDNVGEGARPKRQPPNIRHPVACEEDVTRSMMEVTMEPNPWSPGGFNQRSRSPLTPSEHTERLSSRMSQSEVKYRSRSGDFSEVGSRSNENVVPAYPPSAIGAFSTPTISQSSAAPARRGPVLNQEASEEDIYGGSDSPLSRPRNITAPVDATDDPTPVPPRSHTQPLPISRSSPARHFPQSGPIDLDTLMGQELPSSSPNNRGGPEGIAQSNIGTSSASPRPLNYERNLPDQRHRRSYDNTRNNPNLATTSSASSSSPFQGAHFIHTKPVASHNLFSEEEQAQHVEIPPRPPAADFLVHHQAAALDQSDGVEAEEMICPMCSERQAPGTSFDDFQTHVLGCLGTSNQPPPGNSAGDDKVCPVCNQLFPFTVSQSDFETHVNDHFESDFSILDRDQFAS